MKELFSGRYTVMHRSLYSESRWSFLFPESLLFMGASIDK